MTKVWNPVEVGPQAEAFAEQGCRAELTSARSMSDALAGGQRLCRIRGFGGFSCTLSTSAHGAQSQDRRRRCLAGKYVPHFKPGKDLRDRVNENRQLAADKGLRVAAHFTSQSLSQANHYCRCQRPTLLSSAWGGKGRLMVVLFCSGSSGSSVHGDCRLFAALNQAVSRWISPSWLWTWRSP
ncbi:MAG: HU family DNA-binding protein [Gammaproteobacteria bacterium]